MTQNLGGLQWDLLYEVCVRVNVRVPQPKEKHKSLGRVLIDFDEHFVANLLGVVTTATQSFG